MNAANIAKKGITGLTALGILGQSDDAEAMFIGEKAAPAIIKAGKEFLKAHPNASPLELWKNTKTYRDKFGNWSTVMDDRFSEADFGKLVNFNKAVNPASMTVDKVLKHPDLFTAYPELKGYRVVQMDPVTMAGGTKAQINHGAKTIALNHKLLDTPQKMRSTLIHEMQHGVQNLEFWPKGSSDDFFSPKASKEFTDKAYAVEKKQRLAKAQADLADKRAMDNLKWGDDAKYEAALAEAKKQKELYSKYLDQSITLRKAAVELDPVEQYWRSAGEVQARMAQRQLDVDPTKVFPGHLDYNRQYADEDIIRNPMESEANRYDPEYLKSKYPGHDFSKALDKVEYTLSKPGRTVAGLVGAAVGGPALAGRLYAQDQSATGDELEAYINRFQKKAPILAPFTSKIAKMANLAYTFGL